METKPYQFKINDLGNVEIVDRNGFPLEDFIRHIEVYLLKSQILRIYITEEDLEVTKTIYIYLRYEEYEDEDVIQFMANINKEYPKIQFHYEKIQAFTDVTIIDIFLYG
ncbi:MAG: hypothetical protein WC225_05400 [Acholeplasmataceae bacterium]|nr:hypothetical protein [Acholeplasmataceae bacterium]